jgi:hypothetical protein
VIALPRCAPAALLFAACASAPDLRYASADPADTWDSGIRWHTSFARSLACSTAFVGAETDFNEYPAGRALVFQVKLGNRSDSTFRIDPSDFRAYAPGPGTTFRAADPESALADVDRRKRSVDNDYGINLAIQTTLAVGDLFVQIASLASNDRSRPQDCRKDEGQEHWRNDEEKRYQEHIARLKDERAYWEQGHLRRTDLVPGRALASAISIPFPGDGLPPDTLVLQWAPAGRKPLDLGLYGRPPAAFDSLPPRKAPARPEDNFFLR